MMVGRGAKRKGTRYFGPYSHAWAIRETVDLLLRVFPMRSCSNGRLQAARADRPAVPARLHRQVRGAVRRAGHARRSTGEIVDDFCDFIGRPDQRASSGASRREMYAALRRAGVRAGRPAARRPRRAQPGARAAGGRARRRHRRRRASRSAEDPLEVAVQIFYVRGGRVRGQRGWVADRVEDADTGGAGRRLPAPAVRRRDRRRRSRARCWCRRCRRTPRPDDGAARRVPRRQGRRSGCRSAATSGRCMETVARNAEAVAGAAQDQARQRPDHPQPGARGDPATRSSSPRRRCGSSATTSPTCRAPRSSRRWWSSRTGCRARASTAGS